MENAIARLARKIAREACDSSRVHGSIPVEITDSSSYQEPTVSGRSYYWTTPSGKTEVRHPNAYGWATLYHPSTLRIVVGREWLRVRLIDALVAEGLAHDLAVRLANETVGFVMPTSIAA